MSEVLILHMNHKDGDLWDKLVDLLDENGYQINHLEKKNRAFGLLKFDGLEILPEQHRVLIHSINGNRKTIKILGKNKIRLFFSYRKTINVLYHFLQGCS